MLICLDKWTSSRGRGAARRVPALVCGGAPTTPHRKEPAARCLLPSPTRRPLECVEGGLARALSPRSARRLLRALSHAIFRTSGQKKKLIASAFSPPTAHPSTFAATRAWWPGDDPATLRPDHGTGRRSGNAAQPDQLVVLTKANMLGVYALPTTSPLRHGRLPRRHRSGAGWGGAVIARCWRHS